MRIFIAILFSKAIKDRLFDLNTILKEKNYHGLYTAYDNLHLTLYYIGETSQDKLTEIKQSLDQISMNAFVIRSKGINYFKAKRNKKIVYLEIEDKEALISCYQAVMDQLKTVYKDIKATKYIPHITLARKIKEDVNSAKNLKIKTLNIKVDAISIMESKRVNDQLIYEELYKIPLK